MKILGLIPARGGSKGLPGKNIKPMLGKSLIQRAFECGRDSDVLDRIILSTDDAEMAKKARGFGLEVPFMRPSEWAQDDTPMMDVVLHALETLGRDGYRPDALLLLQPTNPFRKPAHIQKAIHLLNDHDSVCSVIPLPLGMCPHYVMNISEEGYLRFFVEGGERIVRRQDVPPAYKRDGTIFLTRTAIILNQRTLYGASCVPLLLDPDESLGVDTSEEWMEAEQRLKEQAES